MESAKLGHPAFELDAWMAPRLARVERALEGWVTGAAQPELAQAMRYAVLDGGKRLRPMLALAAHEAGLRGRAEAPAPRDHADDRSAGDEAALRAACALELVHAYSLVHDDLPCMDNDVLRRGKPTVHVRFGQAQALLAGDALQALAFELLTPSEQQVPLDVQARLCHLLARAAGHQGMAGGQAIDLASVGRKLDQDQLQRMHRLKTGALLQASVMMGAACARANAQAQLALADYGASVGLAFQVVDDILDVTMDSATLGKTAGKDAAQEKPTFVALLGLAQAREYSRTLLGQALSALERSALPEVDALRALALMVVRRSK
jgi:farnesyl diphosphate synthase